MPSAACQQGGVEQACIKSVDTVFYMTQ